MHSWHTSHYHLTLYHLETQLSVIIQCGKHTARTQEQVTRNKKIKNKKNHLHWRNSGLQPSHCGPHTVAGTLKLETKIHNGIMLQILHLTYSKASSWFRLTHFSGMNPDTNILYSQIPQFLTTACAQLKTLWQIYLRLWFLRHNMTDVVSDYWGHNCNSSCFVLESKPFSVQKPL